jgi:RNA polymerase sigma factor (sigma-70 family)
VTGAGPISRRGRPRRSLTVASAPFQRVLDRHRDAVHRFLVATAGPQDADDCFQETFLSALRAYSRLDGAADVRAWLLTIAHRKAIDHHRSNGRRALPVAEPEELAGATAEPELDEGIWALVGALPPKQRAAVTLRYACDLPHAEIAAALGCSPEAARRSLHEGIKRLRKELA